MKILRQHSMHETKKDLEETIEHLKLMALSPLPKYEIEYDDDRDKWVLWFEKSVKKI